MVTFVGSCSIDLRNGPLDIEGMEETQIHTRRNLNWSLKIGTESRKFGKVTLKNLDLVPKSKDEGWREIKLWMDKRRIDCLFLTSLKGLLKWRFQ